MSEEGRDADSSEPTSLRVKAGQIMVALIVVPLVASFLLAWTLLGRLCSLRACPAFIMVVVLALTPIVVDWTLEWDSYSFDSSLLDPVCVVVAMYLVCLLALRHQGTISGGEAAKRRLASLPLAVGVVAFLAVKIVAVSGADDEERWKVAWLWFALLFSFFVYASMAGWWTGASTPRLEVAEAALLKQYGQVEFEQSVVSGLGTVCVKGSDDPEDGFSTAQGGSGRPVLVLVHGYAAGNAFWMFVLKDLAAHFRVVCVEMYGCGRSDRLPFNAKGPAATEKLVVASLEKWRAEMGIEEMVLCGHSLGGMISAAYAMAHPHRLRKLMLLSPAGVGGVPDSGDGGDNSFAFKVYAFLWTRGVFPVGVLRWAGPLGSRAAQMLVAKRLKFVPESAKIRDVDTKLLGDYVYQLLALPASGEKLIFPLLTPMLHAYVPVVETLKGGVARGGGGELGESEARGINCPVSIIYGSPDHDWMPTMHGEKLVERLTQQGIRANVYIVPEAGHTLIIDNPVDFTRIFLEACFDAGVAGPTMAAKAKPPTPVPPVGPLVG